MHAVGQRAKKGGAQKLNRESWVRKADWIDLSSTQIAALLRPAIGKAKVVAARRVPGGLVNTNLQITLAGPPHCVLLRVCQRDPPQARKEAAIDRLICGSVPSARLIYFNPDDPITARPVAVFQWIEGIQLDHAAREADDATRRELGAAVGETLARIHSFRFPRHGFFTDDLQVPTSIDLDRNGLLRFMHRCMIEGPGGARLGAVLTQRLFAFVEREGHRLNAWLDQPRLTHADCNPSNILVRQDKGRWCVAAVVDWEFALSATPAFDFGNILRPPFGSWPDFVAGFTDGYQAAGGVLPDEWQFIARIADLFAWVDLLGQRGEDPALAADARRVVGATLQMANADSFSPPRLTDGV